MNHENAASIPFSRSFVRFVISFFAATVLLISTPTQAGLSQWPVGENICEGGWQYEQLASCQSPGTIVDGVITSGTCVNKVETGKTFTPCRHPVTDVGLGCGPENYHSCPSMNCPGSIKGDWYEDTQTGDVCQRARCNAGYSVVDCYSPGFDSIVVQCERAEIPASCENSGCNVRTWKLCRHTLCPVEKIFYGCLEWSKAYSDTCGKSQQISGLKTAKPNDVASDGRRVADFYGLGSSCLTCDDIPLDTRENVQKRFNCLAKGYDLAESAAAGYSFKTTRIILQQLQEMASSYSSDLTPEQIRRLSAILSN